MNVCSDREERGIDFRNEDRFEKSSINDFLGLEAD